MTFLIAAAGTGGHVFPGLAVGQGLLHLGIDKNDIIYVGGDRLEATIYPEAGFRFLGVELAGLKRSFTIENLRIPSVVRRARQEIEDEIQRSGVDVVLGMGGYVTIPAGLAARRRHVPLFNAEQNAEAGLANRVTSRWARQTFVSFPETKGLPSGIWAGNPVREAFWDFDRGALRTGAMTHFDLPDALPVVGVFGGSLGAKAINEAVVEMLDSWREPAISLLHITGDLHHQELHERMGDMTGIEVVWRTLPFVSRMDLFYAACDLVIARAGGAVAEITSTGTPSVLVPGRFGSGTHQEDNARALEEVGAALVVPEDSLDGLGVTVATLIGDAGKRAAMAAATGEIAKPDAARTIARAMVEAAS